MAIQIPPEFDQNAFQNECRTLLVTNLLGRCESGRFWFMHPRPQSVLSVKSFDAVAYKFFGIFHHQDSIKARGEGSYGEALSHLGLVLRNDEPSVCINTLVATMSLLLYEVWCIHCLKQGGFETRLTTRVNSRH